ncbi:MAG: helix-turn-helix domain-containing protein [Sulfuritalea sp.]|nr:helix-turn-helix domain-containing protein [Sulfuritalea sp.]
MAKKPKSGLYALSVDRQTFIAIDAIPRASLKDLRKNAKQTQEHLAAVLCVGQDTISRLEKRSDMLLSTLQHYVESVGGQLALVATFPDKPPVIIDPFKKAKAKKRNRKRTAADHGEP